MKMTYSFWNEAQDKLVAAKAADLANEEDAMRMLVVSFISHLCEVLPECEEVHGVES